MQAVTFNECTNLRVSSLRIKDAQQMHVIFQKCVNVKAFNLLVTAPGNSPNTDGIHVTGTQNIYINNCVIGTGIYIYTPCIHNGVSKLVYMLIKNHVYVLQMKAMIASQ